MARLFTIHNAPTTVTVTIDREDVTDPYSTYRVSWSWRSADGVVRGSGGLGSLGTFDEARAAAEGAYECFIREYEPSEWRNHLKRRVDAVRVAQRERPASSS